jgi:hypothetical protein
LEKILTSDDDRGQIGEIGERRSVVEMAFDPWRYQAGALRLERGHGVNAVQFPQSYSRMTAASENLHPVIVEAS